MVFLGITHCRKCWAKLKGEIGLCESCSKHEEVKNMEKQLEKNESKFLDTKVYVDGVELPKMETHRMVTPQEDEIKRLEYDLQLAKEQLKHEKSKNTILENGILEFVKILGKRSM